MTTTPEVVAPPRDIYSRAPITHIHIPKTAGTSLRSALVGEFGAEEVLVYDVTTDTIRRASQRHLGSEKPAVDKVKKLLFKCGLYSVVEPLARRIRDRGQQGDAVSPETLRGTSYRAISGHFSAGVAKEWGLNDNLTISVVRNPLERALSYYKHHTRTEGDARPKALSKADRIMPIDEFLENPQLTNAQSHYLEGLHAVKVAPIELASHLLEEVGFKPAALPHLNQSPNSLASVPSQTAIAAFVARNAVDFELYQSACERWR